MFFIKKPLITVVIPAYNHERFIGQAIESVLNQTHRHLNVLVIDDGSTDRTGQIAKGYTDPRLTYIHQENQDAYNTLNRGIRMATGGYVSILNSDDVYTPERLEKLLAIQKKRKSACLFTDVQPISELGEHYEDPDFWWNRWHEKNRRFYFECKDIYRAFMKGNFMVTTSNIFMTAEAARKVGGFSPLRYLHDYDYIFRMMVAFPGGVHYIHDQKLLYYRLHGSNTIGEAAIIGREQDKMVIRKYLLETIPVELRGIVDSGIDRLIELEMELIEVKAQIARQTNPS